MDLLLNFLCSAEEIDLNLKSIIVFVGDEKYIQLVENMGANAIYSPALGSMPAGAAKFYMDDTFARMMWFKTTSVYLALVSDLPSRHSFCLFSSCPRHPGSGLQCSLPRRGLSMVEGPLPLPARSPLRRSIHGRWADVPSIHSLLRELRILLRPIQ